MNGTQNVLTPVQLRELINGTSFPLPGKRQAAGLIDYPAECDRWLAATAEWRAGVVRFGFEDEWAPKIEQIRREALDRAVSGPDTLGTTA